MNAVDDFLAGVGAVAPALIGVIPFAAIVGVAAVNVGMTPIQAISMSALVFAGASQLAVIDLLGTNSPIIVIIFTAVVINFRFVMYSASIAPYFGRFGTPSKWFGAYLLTDLAYAVSVAEYQETTRQERSRLWYYLGTAFSIWLVWQAATAGGAILGTTIPDDLSLEFAVTLTFMAVLFQSVEGQRSKVAAVVAGAFGVAMSIMPFNLGLLASAVIGVAAAVGLDLRAGDFPRSETDRTRPSR